MKPKLLTIQLRNAKPMQKPLPEMIEFVRALALKDSVRKIETLKWSTGRDVTVREFAEWFKAN